MVNFFSKGRRRPESYQGFNKYTDELNRYLNQESNNVAGVASTGISRSQSMTQGAGQAAMIAIQRHNQQQNQQTPHQVTGPKQETRKANSLTAASNRSNSMRSYTYHPKPSYTVGQTHGSTNQGVGRFNSLNSKSSSGPYRPNPRTNSLTSQNLYMRSRSPPVLDEQDEEEEEDGDVTITTKTTKVVDAQGRVLTVTVETIKTFADGSTVTNTTTKNISRSNSRANSRANSLNSQSMTLRGNAPIKHNSMLSNGAGGNYNLSKIDENLQDFDYNYELDHDALTQKGRGHPHVDNLIHDENFNDHGLRLNYGNFGSSYHGDNSGPPELLSHEGGNESINSNGHLKSIASDSSKPLKSILKKKVMNDKDSEAEEGFADAVDELHTNQLETEDDTQHPYKSLGSPQFNEPLEFKVPQSPNMQAPQQSNRIITNTGNKRIYSPVSSPLSKHDDVMSDRSTSNSIKFLEKRETIPIYYDNKKPKEAEHAKSSDQDFYSIAMQVAMERVYGNKETEQLPKSEEQRSKSMNSHTSPILGPKKDKQIPELNEQGVNDDYVYQNHHKDFVGLSLRDNVEPTQTSRKERAKEEKKQQKSEMKEQRQKMKEKEKLEAESSKASSKEQKKLQKTQKHGRFASLFGRRKSTSSDSILTTDGPLNEVGMDNNSQPINSHSNPILDNPKSPGYIAEHQKLTNNDTSKGERLTATGSGAKTTQRGTATTFNPEVERLMSGRKFNTDKEHHLMNTNSSNPQREHQLVNHNNYNHETNSNTINQIRDTEGLNNNKYEDDSYVGHNYNSVNNAPSRPVFNNADSGSYSMKFPRTDDTKFDTENLADSSSFNSKLQNQDLGGSNAGQKVVQDMPGSMPGVDSSILRAIVQDDTEVGPSFDDNVSIPEQRTTLDPSPSIINDRTSVYSNDAEGKRKGKLLDPITVPVLNEIKSEAASIESQSNRYTDLDAELGTVDNNNPDELFDSGNIHGNPESAREALNQGIEETGDSTQSLQECSNSQLTPNPNFESNIPKDDEFINEAILVNEDDTKVYDNTNALSDDYVVSSLDQNQDLLEPSISKVEDKNNASPVVSNSDRIYTHSDDSGQVPEYEKTTTHIAHSPSQLADTFSNNRKNENLTDTYPDTVNDSLEYINKNDNGNLSNNGFDNSPPQNLQSPIVPTNNEFASEILNGNNSNARGTVTNREQLQSSSVPNSSFEHMQREESDSPVVVHNDHDVNDSKPLKKNSKFKQKLFKYFVNSYNN